MTSFTVAIFGRIHQIRTLYSRLQPLGLGICSARMFFFLYVTLTYGPTPRKSNSLVQFIVPVSRTYFLNIWHIVISELLTNVQTVILIHAHDSSSICRGDSLSKGIRSQTMLRPQQQCNSKLHHGAVLLNRNQTVFEKSISVLLQLFWTHENPLAV